VATKAISESRRRGRPPLDIDLPAVRRLAGLGLTAQTIADRLGVSRRTLFSRLETDPKARAMYDGGIAELVEFAAAKLHGLIAEGNLGAICFVLKTKGGFNVPREPPLAIHVAEHVVTIDGSHVLELAARHSALLDEPWSDE
jgi:hypothetical protein